MSQISLPFDWSGAGQPGEFLVSDANVQAARHMEHWHDWPVPVSILSGPPRSGRSTLGKAFARLSGGNVIDDAERHGEESLFHAWNRALSENRPLLLIAREPPERWTIALPDLRSRLHSVPHVRIGEPDEALLRGLIEAGLNRAGTRWSPDFPEWLTKRIERSYAALDEVLACLNAASLSHGRKISVPFAKESLQRGGFLPIVYSDPDQ